MSEKYRALQGFRDILPEEQPYWRFVEETAATVADLFGYERIETPILEETSLFRRTSGEGTDLVDKEMYSFDDRADKEGNRQNISLRPEGTLEQSGPILNMACLSYHSRSSSII